MTFFTQKVLRDLEEREKELSRSSYGCLETDNIDELADQLKGRVTAAAAAVAAASA